MKLDNFTRPGWYYNDGKAIVGPLDYAEQQDLNVAQHAVIKYVTRAGRKPGNTALKDYKQALFYLNYLIERVTPVAHFTETWGHGPFGGRRTGPADRRKCNTRSGPYRRQDSSGRAPELGRRKTDAVRWLLDLPYCEER